MNLLSPPNPLLNPSAGTLLTLPPDQSWQLSQARSPAQMSAYLAATVGPPPGNGARSAACHVLDMKYAPAEQCTILYQWGERLFIGLLPWTQATEYAASSLPAHHIAALDLWLYPFPHDPALPTLPTVLEGAALTEALRAVLPICRAGAADLLGARATPLRYRPGRRCTLQIDLHLQQRRTGARLTQRLYGKLYHDAAKAAAVYEEMGLLADAVAGAGSALTVAEAVAFSPALNLVLQAPVAGRPLDLLLAQSAVAAPLARTAQALAVLHGLPLTSARLRPLTNDLHKVTRRAAKVATVAPALGEQMLACAQQLAALAAHLPPWESVACMGHGDCKPSQFLLTPDQVVLLDFDHGGMADPAADVGLFLATLRQAQVQQQSKSATRSPAPQRSSATAARINAFYTAYGAATNAPAPFAQRVAWYEGIALLRKALRSFARSPWSPLPALLMAEARCGLDKVDR